MQYSNRFLVAFYGISAILILQYSGADSWLASEIFNLTQGWELRQNWWLNGLIHHGGRRLISIIVVVLIAITLLSYWRSWFTRPQRLALLYASCATVVSMALIAGLKHLTTLPCPWDVQGMGGDLPYLYLHQVFDSQQAGQQCYPAGHASGGYALFSAYFAAKIWNFRGKNLPGIKKAWLLPALILGGIFGLAQQLRGAHFLSHDVTTALLCWYCCSLMYFIFLRLSPVYNFYRRNYAVSMRPDSINALRNSKPLTMMEKSQ